MIDENEDISFYNKRNSVIENDKYLVGSSSNWVSYDMLNIHSNKLHIYPNYKYF